VKARKDFERHIDAISTGFANHGFQIRGMVNQLHATEEERVLEAMHSMFERCRFSAVAMAVSAIEFCLLNFMKRLTPDASELDRLPLGRLIEECLDEQKPYAAKLPDRFA